LAKRLPQNKSQVWSAEKSISNRPAQKPLKFQAIEMFSKMMKHGTHQHNFLADLNPDKVIQDASPDPIIFYEKDSAAQIRTTNI